MKQIRAAVLAIALAACAHAPPVAVVPVCPVAREYTREELLALAAALEWLATLKGPEVRHAVAIVRAENERRNLRDQAQACRVAATERGQGQ